MGTNLSYLRSDSLTIERHHEVLREAVTVLNRDSGEIRVEGARFLGATEHMFNYEVRKCGVNIDRFADKQQRCRPARIRITLL